MIDRESAQTVLNSASSVSNGVSWLFITRKSAMFFSNLLLIFLSCYYFYILQEFVILAVVTFLPWFYSSLNCQTFQRTVPLQDYHQIKNVGTGLRQCKKRKQKKKKRKNSRFLDSRKNQRYSSNASPCL